MGDRANVKIEYGVEGPPVYFYTHWDGTELPEIVRTALKHGRARWDDSQYLPRIIFCAMVADHVSDDTGYGISTFIGDGGDRIITVNTEKFTVRDFSGHEFTFEQYVNG